MLSAAVIFALAAWPEMTHAIGGAALRLCRELNYEHVISRAAQAEFAVAPDAAQSVDLRLVERYQQLSEKPQATHTCLFHWKNLMCSHVFRTAEERAACGVLCVAVQRHCTAEMPDFCSPVDSAARCTDYGELTGFCAGESSSPSGGSPPLPPSGNDAPDRQTTVVVAAVIILLIVTSRF